MRTLKIILFVSFLLIFSLFIHSRGAYAQTGVATLNPLSCNGDCVQTGFGWEYDPILECTYGVGAFHTLTFDISGVDFEVDKIRLRYLADGHDGVGEYTMMDVNQFALAEVTDYGFVNGYDYWELQLQGDWNDIGDTMELFNSHALLGDCFRGRSSEAQSGTFETFNYFGLDSAYPPILELVDANTELPPIESAPTAVGLSSNQAVGSSTAVIVILLSVALLTLSLGFARKNS